jgi:hypothetical protein
MRSLRRLFILFLAGFAGCLTAAAATNTTLTVTAAGNPVTSVASGTVVTLTAQVNAGAVTTGLVNFCDATAAHCTDVHILGSAQLASAGLAVFSFVPGIGAHSYNAVFVGTSSNAGSLSNTASLTVTGGLFATTTNIAQFSGEQGNYTIAATLTGIDFTTAPTGSLALLDTSNNNASIATVPLGTLTPGGIFTIQGIANSLDANTTQVIVAGDFNGDGKPDIAIANANNTVSVLLGKGNGTFTAGSNPATSNAPVGMVVADFNGDGKLDLATVNSDSSITVLLGNGDGTFTAAASQQSVTGNVLAVADVNGDGIPDLIVGGSSPTDAIHPFNITTLLGKGDGTFSTSSQKFSELSGNFLIALGDFNGDGKQDIALAAPSPSNNANSFNGLFAILLGNGDGTFSAGSFTAQVGGVPTSIAVADFNLDGKPDVVVQTIDQPVILTGYVGGATVLLGNGDGTFTTPTGGVLAGAASWIAVADFNQDGKPDIAQALGGGQNYGTGGVNVGYGNGDGTFTAGPTSSFIPNVSGQAITTADFNGDGFPDLGALGTNGSATLLYEQTYTANVSFSNLDPAGTGTHQIEASYPGDSNYNSSLSSTVALLFGNPVIVVSPVTLPTATATVPYTQTLTATGGTPPYHYQVASGTPPLGLTLTTAGVLSGITGPGGTVSFTVAVTDSTAGAPNSTSITYALNVLPIDVFVAPTMLPNGAVGVTYNQALTICCGGPPYTFTQQGLPAGLSMSSAGVISGTPTASGTFNVAVSVSEASAFGTQFGYQTYTLTIAPPPPTFTFAAGSATSATVTAGANATYPLSLTPLNGFNAAVTLSCSGLPNEAECSFSPSSPITPSGTAAVTIMLTVSTSEPATSNKATSLPRRAFDNFGRIFSAASLAALFLIRMPRRFRGGSRVLSIAILGILSVGMLSSCGGGNSGQTTPAQSLTPAGAYTFKVTATQQAATAPLSQTTQLTLIVD